MATGLVKWWRARFLAGYRPFSVVGGNTEGSDSEELLGGVTAPCNSSQPESQPILIETESPQVTVDATGTPTPVTGNDEQPAAAAAPAAAAPGTTKQLSFEEFECDVSVAEGDRRRQEFSFTLYDFDGHGKITKDDIAGLVTTIYDTLGASIQVPPCGSKTIKVKLTVSPDQRSSQTRTGCLNTSQPPTSLSGNSSCCHLKHTSCNNATAHATTQSSRRLPRRKRVPRHRCQNERKEVDTHSEDDGENTRTNITKQEEISKRVGPVSHLTSPYSNSSEGDISDDSDISPVFSPLTPLLTANQRKRSGALQRQQLLEIIQANMEKNNLSFHTSRKRHQNERIPSQTSHAEPPSHHNQDCRSPSEPRAQPMAYHKPTRENSHNFVSFSKLPPKSRGNLRKTRPQCGLQRNNTTTQSPRAYVKPQVLTRNVISPNAYTEQHATGNTNRNGGNLIPNNQQPSNQNSTNNHNVQRNETQFNQTPQCGKSSKKHQLKHATREQDQARAMVQVVRWLEKEFSQNAAAASSGRKHVHEHIHHHYHHYHAEALV